MKKFFALVSIISFLSTNLCFAIDDYEDEIPNTIKKERVKLEKKDPGIIKLPNRKVIAKKAFEEKMAQDEKEYQKVRALAGKGNYIFYQDDEGIIKTTKKLTQEEQEEKETKDSWIEGYYMFYKVADKLLRANNLDTQNWRFEIKKKSDEMNAYANAANHVVIYSSMMDTFYDNPDALSWLLGHELSHHILGHIQKNVHAYERIDKLQNGIINSCLLPGAILIFYPIYHSKQRVWFRRIRRTEIEADTEALTLMARAGFDVDYANDVMSTLSQLPETEKYYTDTHPKHKERAMNINKQIAMLDVDSLRLEGAKNLYEKPVMTLKRSSDKNTIVLIPQKSRGSVHYSPVTPQQKVIYKAYAAYLKDDMTKSANLFEEAYKMNKKNYVPCLYLSYINEYNYKKNHNEEALKQAKKWARKAYKKHNTDKNTIKQKMEVEAL